MAELEGFGIKKPEIIKILSNKIELHPISSLYFLVEEARKRETLVNFKIEKFENSIINLSNYEISTSFIKPPHEERRYDIENESIKNMKDLENQSIEKGFTIYGFLIDRFFNIDYEYSNDTSSIRFRVSQTISRLNIRNLINLIILDTWSDIVQIVNHIDNT